MNTTLAFGTILNVPDIHGSWVIDILFALFALVSIAGALTVVLAKDPFHSALALIINFVGLGALFLLLDAAFVAVAQIIVYASAVVVLFLFVIAYLGDRRELLHTNLRAAALGPAGIVVAVGMFVTLGVGVVKANIPSFQKLGMQPSDVIPAFHYGSPQAIGQIFLTKYLLEFEVTSIVLLVAAIGGIAIGLTGRRRHRELQTDLGVVSSDEHKRRFRMRLDARSDSPRHGTNTPVTLAPVSTPIESRDLHGQGSGGVHDTHADTPPISLDAIRNGHTKTEGTK